MKGIWLFFVVFINYPQVRLDYFKLYYHYTSLRVSEMLLASELACECKRVVFNKHSIV